MKTSSSPREAEMTDTGMNELTRAAPRAAAEGNHYIAEVRERSAAHWVVQAHLAFLVMLMAFPVLRLGYERITNTTLTNWLTSWTGLALALLGFVLGFLIVEAIFQGFGLTRVIDVAARELSLYYVSPIAYVVGAAFLFLVGGVFTLDFFQLVQSSPYGAPTPSLNGVFQWMGTLLLLILPLWSMRLLAEEQRQGTIELLLTSPVRDGEVVFGKYIAGLALLMDALALTAMYAVFLLSLGNPDTGPIVGGYLGILLYGAMLLAIGVFASSLTENQVVAAVLSFAIYLTLILVSAGASMASFLSSTQFDAIRSALQALNMFDYLDNFIRGLVDSYSLVFFVSMIAFWLFLAVRVIETRRWR